MEFECKYMKVRTRHLFSNLSCALCCTAVRRIDDDQDPIKNLTNHMSRKLIFLYFHGIFSNSVKYFFSSLSVYIERNHFTHWKKEVFKNKIPSIGIRMQTFRGFREYIYCMNHMRLSNQFFS